ncbi:MAG TPA: sigma-70 family RNA polymerase sigma factor [Candidatus Acidoferrum sp.]|nr:sigma-70 family RNA polymerase sigma factor [Candidatus Acidoferrum sp.]
MAVRRPAQEPSTKGVREELLVQAAQSDPAKFDALYELYFYRVYYFLAARVRNRATAEDLTSEVFHKALANLPNYEWRGAPFGAWLFRIASNALADQYKRASRDPAAPNDPPETSANTDLSSRDLQAIENQVQIFGLVKKLPAAQRRVIYERFVDQRTIPEIAARLKKSEGAIKQLQFRALQTLRAQMEGGHA